MDQENDRQENSKTFRFCSANFCVTLFGGNIRLVRIMDNHASSQCFLVFNLPTQYMRTMRPTPIRTYCSNTPLAISLLLQSVTKKSFLSI